MSAADHINEAQKLRVFHMSWQEQPPHLFKEGRDSEGREGDDDNVHPDVIHAGTRRSALGIHRTQLHEYEIDPDVVDPVVYGDVQYLMDAQERIPDRWQSKEFTKKMSGKQQGLWETIPGKPSDAVNRNVVLPYRNYAEDAGSISYMIPKSLIEQGKVRHVGVIDVSKGGIRRTLEQEEGMYR